MLSVSLLSDFPSATRWLSERERSIAAHRLHKNSGSLDEERGSIVAGVRMAASDNKVWLYCAIVTTKTTAHAVTSFTATLGFEFSKVQTLLIVAPPYALTIICSLSVNRCSERFWHLVVPLNVGMVGYIIAASTLVLTPGYFSLFLMLAGICKGYNVFFKWISSTVS